MKTDFGVFLSGVFYCFISSLGFSNNFLGQVEQLSFKMFFTQWLVGLWRCRIKFFSKPCVTAKLPVPSRIKSVVSKNQKWLEHLEPFVNYLFHLFQFILIDITENDPGSTLRIYTAYYPKVNSWRWIFEFPQISWKDSILRSLLSICIWIQ